MIGSVSNLQGNAEHLSVQQLQQAMRDGTLPPYIGMPILQKKIQDQDQKQAQTAMQGQQGQKPSVAQQIEGEAQSLTRPPMQTPQNSVGQGLSALPSNLPEGYAQGGIIAFAGDAGSYVDPLLNDPYRQLAENRSDAGGIDTSGVEGLANNIQQKGLVEGTALPIYNAVGDVGNQIGNTIGDVGGQIGDATGYATTAVLHGKEGLSKREAEKQKVLEANAIAAKKYGIPVGILNNLTAAESNFNPNAKNANSSATGAHQITTGLAKDYGITNPKDLHNPLVTADIAGDVLRSGFLKYPDDPQKAIATFHLGTNAPESKLAADTAYTNKIYPNTQSISAVGQPPAPATGMPTPYAIPENPQQDFSTPDFSSLKTPVKSPEEYQQQMQQAMGDNAGIAGVKSKLAKLEEEGASAKEKAPWMALMQAGLSTMAGTSPHALTNIGQGGIAGLKAYTEAQDKLDKGEEKRLAIEEQLANAQRAEQMAAWKYGADSHKADVAGNKAIDLAEQKAKIDMQQDKNKYQLEMFKEKADNPLKQAQAAFYNNRAAGASGATGNPSDYEGARNIAMANPTAPQYAKYFTPDPSGKPVWNELAFRADYTKKDQLASMTGADLTQLANGMDPELAQAAKEVLLNRFGGGNAPVGGGGKQGWTVTKN
jgi:hypothetical protein